jgi:hypothetical protein
MQNSENLDTRIFGLTSTLEKPTRGKPVREGLFIIIELLRNFFYSSLIFSKNTNLSQKIYARLLQKKFQNAAPRNLYKNPYNCMAATAINVVWNSSKIVPLFCVCCTLFSVH